MQGNWLRVPYNVPYIMIPCNQSVQFPDGVMYIRNPNYIGSNNFRRYSPYQQDVAVSDHQLYNFSTKNESRNCFRNVKSGKTYEEYHEIYGNRSNFPGTMRSKLNAVDHLRVTVTGNSPLYLLDSRNNWINIFLNSSTIKISDTVWVGNWRVKNGLSLWKTFPPLFLFWLINETRVSLVIFIVTYQWERFPHRWCTMKITGECLSLIWK